MEWAVAGALAIGLGLVWLVWTDPRGAPWVPTSADAVARVLDLARVSSDDVVYDLGSGDGRVVIAAASERGARGVGIELDPIRHRWARHRSRRLGLDELVELHRGDFFDVNLSDATVVVCYLLDRTNRRLESKLEAELRHGTRVVSHSFEFPGLDHVKSEGKLHLYRL